MDLNKLNSRDPTVVEKYVTTKFKELKANRFLRRGNRNKKCTEYYISAGDGPHGRSTIKRVYDSVFYPEFFEESEPLERAAQALARKPEKFMIESSAWFSGKGEDADEIDAALIELKGWLKRNDWQEGESFFARLERRVAFLDDKLCDKSQFQSEFSRECGAAIICDTAVTAEEAKASYDLMVGFKQDAKWSFEARSTNWGLYNAKLEQSFQAGAWTAGSAEAQMTKLGFSAEAQAAIAVGALLNIEGQLSWTKKPGGGGVQLGGSAQVFGGARAEASVMLSASARKGFQAAVAAGAFAGLEFKAEGSCAFVYGDKVLAKTVGSASINFGLGAEFSASIAAPIFGPTVISVASELTVGIGGATAVEVEINFSEIALAANQNFKQVVYWRTMARGYEMTLMNSDAKNLYYLKKCIARLTEESIDTRSSIASYQNTPVEKRRLLIAS